jgi:hypothetical protein
LTFASGGLAEIMTRTSNPHWCADPTAAPRRSQKKGERYVHG